MYTMKTNIIEGDKQLLSKLHCNNTFCSQYDAGWVKLPLMGWMCKPGADEPHTCFTPTQGRYKVPYTFTHTISASENKKA